MPARHEQLKMQALQRKCSHLQAAVARLQGVRDNLLFRQGLLDALCESFSLLHTNATAQFLSDADETTWSSSLSDRFQELLELESSLLRELSTGLGVQQSPPVAQQRDLGVDTIAPRSDPLAYFKHHACQVPKTAAAAITAKDLAGMLRATMLEASVQLHMLQTQMPSVQRQEVTQQLAELWSSYLAMVFSAILYGRQHMVETVLCYNLSKLEEDPQGAVSGHAQQLAALPPLLGLTPGQLKEITAGTSLFVNLLQSVLSEQQQLQTELSSGISNSSDSISSASDKGLQELEAHERDTGRMQVLLHKEYALRAAAAGFLIGCFSWEQLTRAAVVCWPFPLRLTLLAQEIACYAQQKPVQSPNK